MLPPFWNVQQLSRVLHANLEPIDTRGPRALEGAARAQARAVELAHLGRVGELLLGQEPAGREVPLLLAVHEEQPRRAVRVEVERRAVAPDGDEPFLARTLEHARRAPRTAQSLAEVVALRAAVFEHHL